MSKENEERAIEIQKKWILNRSCGAEVLATAIDDAEERGRLKGLEGAAKLVESWHIKKGGYHELAFQIRRLAEVKMEKLKPCPFCGGEVEYHEDECGGAWVEHKIKHVDGKQDPCILTGSQINFHAEYGMSWNRRDGEKYCAHGYQTQCPHCLDEEIWKKNKIKGGQP